MKDELEEIPKNPNITDDHFEDETKRPRVIEAYWEFRSEKLSTDGCNLLLMGYARSLFRDFESHLRIVVGLDEGDIQLVLKQYNVIFVNYELDRVNYTIEDLQEAVYQEGDDEGTLQIEYDDLNKKTQLTLTQFGSTFGTLRFDKFFIWIIWLIWLIFHTKLGFTPYWDYKPTNANHADSPGVYTNDKLSNLNRINKIHLKCDGIDGSIQDGIRQPIPFSFVLKKNQVIKYFANHKQFVIKR